MKNFMDRCLPFCSTLFSKELVGKPTALVTVGNFKEYLQLNENNYSKYEKEEEESVLNCLTNMQSFSKIIGLNII
jgi:multimeric flavodoxin WrbA